MYQLILILVMMIISALLMKAPPSAQPSTFQATTAEAGRPIPVLYGSVLLKNPNVVWWGNLTTTPIIKKVGGFLGLGEKSYTIGYTYAANLQLALCHGPIDSINFIRASDTDVEYSTYYTSSDHLGLLIQDSLLFGGEEQGGGLEGSIDLYLGNTAQTVNPYLSAWFGGAPSYPGLCYAVLRGWTNGAFVLGNSAYPKSFAFGLSRYPKIPGLTAGHEKLNRVDKTLPTGGSGGQAHTITTYDANPACMFYDALTNGRYSQAVPDSRIDLASFRALADLLYGEGAGMSMVLDQTISLDEFKAEIEKTCNVIFFVDPSTGLWTAKPIRYDYDPATLIEFTVDDLLGAPDWSRRSWADTVNTLKISFPSRSVSYNTQTIQAIEQANYAAQGEQKSLSLTYNGVSCESFAQAICMRDLRTLSYPLAHFTSLKLNRRAYALRPGSAFKLTWQPPTGPAFAGMVLRVTNIRYGRLEGNGEEGAITIEAVEDVFGVSSTAYLVPGASDWHEPVLRPLAPVVRRLMEAPYQIVGAARWVLAMASRGDTTTTHAQVWTELGAVGSYAHTGDMPAMTPSGPLTVDYSYRTFGTDTAGFKVTVASGVDMSQMLAQNTDAGGLIRGDNLALIDDELVSWQTCTDNGDGTFTFAPVLRGVMDTVPVTHTAATRVWFISGGAGLTSSTAYTTDQTVKAKILTANMAGVLDLATAPIDSLATASRATAPNPPNNMQANGLKYGAWPATTLDDLTFTWTHRNRLTIGQGSLLVNQDYSTADAIEGVLQLEILVGGVVKHTLTNQTVSTYVYTAAQRIADDTDGTKGVQIRVSPSNGSLNGTVRTTTALVMTGAGMCAGIYCGGLQG